MFSTVGVMNRRTVEGMSPAWDFACIVGPGQTPLRAAATSEEEQRLPYRPYALDDNIIFLFLDWKASPSTSPGLKGRILGAVGIAVPIVKCADVISWHADQQDGRLVLALLHSGFYD
ncbi:unnamed protein product [Pleuronectes platessa]|uniref:Uncharacterized protein n=1 Tax=Pleuronectes platessa TaxID=8262 RepID=A0A9N7YE36_PLEPL|nr:unnamed protein product [Pleuronectes platessa]